MIVDKIDEKNSSKKCKVYEKIQALIHKKEVKHQMILNLNRMKCSRVKHFIYYFNIV